MFIVVGKDPCSKDLEVITCDSPQELHKRTAHYTHREFVVLSGGKVLKNVEDTVVKKDKKTWTLGLL